MKYRMCSWFWVKWCNYFCCVMFDCWVIHSKKSQKLSLKHSKNISATTLTMRKSFVPFCSAQDSEFSTTFIMLAYVMHCLWSQYFIVKYQPSPCYVCLCVCLFVCLFVCLQGGLIAVLTALSYHDKFTGLILSSPAMYGEIGTITVSQIMIVRPNI